MRYSVGYILFCGQINMVNGVERKKKPEEAAMLDGVWKYDWGAEQSLRNTANAAAYGHFYE